MYREYSGGLVAELSAHQMDFCNTVLGNDLGLQIGRNEQHSGPSQTLYVKESLAEKNGYLNPVAIWEEWGISGPSRLPFPRPLRRAFRREARLDFALDRPHLYQHRLSRRGLAACIGGTLDTRICWPLQSMPLRH